MSDGYAATISASVIPGGEAVQDDAHGHTSRDHYRLAVQDRRVRLEERKLLRVPPPSLSRLLPR